MKETIMLPKTARRFLNRHRSEIALYEAVMNSSLNTIGNAMLKRAKIARKVLRKEEGK
jgi:hypothetical protein